MMQPTPWQWRAAGRYLTLLSMATASVAVAAPPLPPAPLLPPPPPVIAPATPRAGTTAPTGNDTNRDERPERQTRDRNGANWTPDDMRAVIAAILSRPIDDRPIIDDSVTGMGNPDLWEAALRVRTVGTTPDPRPALAAPRQSVAGTITAR